MGVVYALYPTFTINMDRRVTLGALAAVAGGYPHGHTNVHEHCLCRGDVVEEPGVLALLIGYNGEAVVVRASINTGAAGRTSCSCILHRSSRAANASIPAPHGYQ